jgi:hypothetical protein
LISLDWVVSCLKTSYITPTSLKSLQAAFPFKPHGYGTQNILIDTEFNFFAIIDWECAVRALGVNHYPMPFPLLSSDAEIAGVLRDLNHRAYVNVSRQDIAQKVYKQKFRDAERGLRDKGRVLGRLIAEVLDGKASRVYAVQEKLDTFLKAWKTTLRMKW